MTYAPIPNEDVDVGSPLSTALVTQLRDTAEYARIGYVSVSGATQALDIEAGQFFDAGTLTVDTTVSFSNVPTEARWSYTADVSVDESFSVSDLVYNERSFKLDEDDFPSSIFFKSDGTKMYMIGEGGDSAYQYSLSSAWDVSTASYDSVSFSFSAQMGNPQGLFFKPDGTKMYIIGRSTDKVWEYTLSTGWDLSTASYSGNSFSVLAQDGNGRGVFFKPDGTKMYVTGSNTGAVFQYSLSTAWSVSTASYDSKSYTLTSPYAGPYAASFTDDGTKMIVITTSAAALASYSLSTAWDVSTASFEAASYDFTPLTGTSVAFAFKDDGNQAYILSGSLDTVYQFDSASFFSVSFPASVQNPPTGAIVQDNLVSYTFFTADGGTNVYLINEEAL